jgi:hypothetical protein
MPEIFSLFAPNARKKVYVCDRETFCANWYLNGNYSYLRRDTRAGRSFWQIVEATQTIPNPISIPCCLKQIVPATQILFVSADNDAIRSYRIFARKDHVLLHKRKKT